MVRFGTFLAVYATALGVAHADVGRVISLRGQASITRVADGGYARIELERGMKVNEGDQLRTRSDSSVRIVFTDRSLLNVGENASVVVQQYKVKNAERRRKVGIKVWAGRTWARVTKWFGGGENNFEVRTPNAVAGVRGTEFSVDVSPTGETSVTVYEGSVAVGAPEGNANFALLVEGERSRVSAAGSAVKETVAPSELKADRQKSQRSGGLDPKETKKRIDQAETQSKSAPPAADGPDRKRPGPANDLPSDLDENGGNNAPPPLDLDPASGESRVRGRVEIRE